MDSISTIAAAIALGAAASAGHATVSEVVKDAYKNLKSAIKREHPSLQLAILEDERKASLTHQQAQDLLVAHGNIQTPEVLQAAHEVIMSVIDYEPMMATSIGVNLKDFTGTSLLVEDISASGSGVVVEGGKLSGDISIRNVRAGVNK